MGEDQYLTSLILPQMLAPLVMHNFTRPLQFALKNMTLQRTWHYLQICGGEHSYQKRKVKSDNSRLSCIVTGFHCMGDEI